MLTTLDLPDALLLEVKSVAAQQGTSLELFLQIAIEAELQRVQKRAIRRVKFPILDSREPSTLRLTNADIEDILA